MARPDDVLAESSSAPLRLVPLSEAIVPAIHAFHERLRVHGGPHYRLGTSVELEPAIAAHAPAVRTETLFAFDGIHVRGGIMLQHHQARLANGTGSVVNIQLPLSEGTIDHRFSHVGMWLIRNVLRTYPRAFCVGMGGLTQPLPKLLQAMRWSVVPVPFFFRVNRVGRVLAQMPALKQSRARRLASGFARATGGGWLAVHALQGARALRSFSEPAFDVRRVSEWDAEAGSVWQATKGQYDFAVERDVDALRCLYPLGDARTQAWEVVVKRNVVGWVAVMTTQMTDNPYFGDLHVGTVLDSQSLDGFAPTVARAAHKVLRQLGADLELANHLHVTWQDAFKRAGFLSAPSNFLFAASPALMKAASDTGQVAGLGRFHVTRGDGDGRVNL